MSSSSTRVLNGPTLGPKPESFGGFFETWLLEQEKDLDDLKAAAAAVAAQTDESTQCNNTELTRSFHDLVERVMGHYEKYYRVKSESMSQNVLAMLTPSWRSNLEEAFLWIGGWRPTMAFHLLYSVTGLQLEAGLSELIRGLNTGDLGSLSSSQLARVDELQMQTVREERELTEKLASHQETVADSSMVKLSNLATELMRDPNSLSHEHRDSVEEEVESTLCNKEEKLKEIFGKADDLRLRTLKNLVDILEPIQAVYFLIAASELHLRVHDWGLKKDASTNNSQQQS